MQEDSRRITWRHLALAQSVRLGVERYTVLLEGSDRDSLQRARRVASTTRQAERLGALLRQRDRWQRELDACRKRDVWLLPADDPAYPAYLKNIADPPLILYGRGLPLPESPRAVAVVGARVASPYGLSTAERLGEELARCGIGVVSGLALGIDGAAHRGAIAGRGYSVAVLGCGVDLPYPKSHERIYQSLCDCGTVLSEFPLHTPARPAHFPRRNRIISGLSAGVVVVEARRRSGSLITVRHALDQGREVMAVPGRVDGPLSRGPHDLIRDGAALVASAEDILNALAFLPAYGKATTMEKKVEPGLSVEEEQLRRTVGEGLTWPDSMSDRLGWEIRKVSSMLMDMELRGIVRKMPDGSYFLGRRELG